MISIRRFYAAGEAHEKPVVLTFGWSHSPKAVYSVREYPKTIGGSAFGGPAMTTVRECRSIGGLFPTATRDRISPGTTNTILV